MGTACATAPPEKRRRGTTREFKTAIKIILRRVGLIQDGSGPIVIGRAADPALLALTDTLRRTNHPHRVLEPQAALESVDCDDDGLTGLTFMTPAGQRSIRTRHLFLFTGRIATERLGRGVARRRRTDCRAVRRPAGIPLRCRVPLKNARLGREDVVRIIGLCAASGVIAGSLKLLEFGAYLRASDGAVALRKGRDGRGDKYSGNRNGADERLHDDELRCYFRQRIASTPTITPFRRYSLSNE
jgi:hypothetical protein